MRLRKYVAAIALGVLVIGVLATTAFSQLLIGPSISECEQVKWEERDIIIRVRGTWHNARENEDIKKWYEANNLWGPRSAYANVWFHLTHPRVKIVGIDWDMGGAEAGQRLMAGLATGHAPAKYPFTIMGNLPSCVEMGVLADITDTVLERHSQWWEAMPEYIRANCMYQGRIWGLPKPQSSNYPGDIIRYRKDWFEEAGIFNAAGEPGPNYEWTWDDFRDIAKKLTNPKENRWGIALEARNAGRNTFERICQTFGVPVLIPDKSGKYTWRAGFDTPETMNTAFKLYHDLVFEDKSGLSSVEYDWVGCRNEYRAHRVGMTFYPFTSLVPRSVFYPHWLDPVKLTIDIDGAAPWPKGPYGTRKMNQSVEVSAEWGFDPSLTPEQLEAVVDWVHFWEFGGAVHLQALTYYLNDKSPEMRFPDIIGPKDMYKLPGVPTMDETMPKDYLKCKQFLHAQPIPSTRFNYGIALRDSAGFLSGIDNAIQTAMTNPDWNKVVESIESAAKQVNVSALNHKTGTMEDMKAYLAALDKYYKDNYPTYHEKMFKSLWSKYYKI